eukprot:IDg8947t1
MESRTLNCTHCGRTFSSLAALRRHEHSALRTADSLGDAHAAVPLPSTIDSNYANSGHLEDPMPSPFRGGTVDIAEEVRRLYRAFGDKSEPVFPTQLQLVPSNGDLCRTAKFVLRHCCVRRLSDQQVQEQFELISAVTDSCTSCTELSEQFANSRVFAVYVDRQRKSFVNSQGWRRAVIDTAAGLNRTGVFRNIVSVLVDEICAAGGPRSITKWRMNRQNNRRMRSSPLDSDALRDYEATAGGDLPVLAFDMYADSTILSKSGSQSACLVRIRPTNISERFNLWHDVAIAPHMGHAPSLSQARMAQERCTLFQRFLFLLLSDVVEASRIRLSIEGELFVVRLVTLVADQPQERAFLGLNASGSFMDCTLCMQQSKHFSDGPDDTQEFPDEILLVGIRSGSRRIYDRSDIANAKRYLRRVSASLCPPALAALYGLGTAPFNLYSCVAFDTLHVVDLGLSRSIPDLAFSVFASTVYNRN